jgi:hypothetical protein
LRQGKLREGANAGIHCLPHFKYQVVQAKIRRNDVSTCRTGVFCTYRLGSDTLVCRLQQKRQAIRRFSEEQVTREENTVFFQLRITESWFHQSVGSTHPEVCCREGIG